MKSTPRSLRGTSCACWFVEGKARPQLQRHMSVAHHIRCEKQFRLLSCLSSGAANASGEHMQRSLARHISCTQHSVQLTVGMRRVF
jgi:hypothetical protein